MWPNFGFFSTKVVNIYVLRSKVWFEGQNVSQFWLFRSKFVKIWVFCTKLVDIFVLRSKVWFESQNVSQFGFFRSKSAIILVF